MTILNETALVQVTGYNESEVRFHVIDPVLRALAYPEKEGTYLKLEEKLDYPYMHIGHKTPKKDVPLVIPPKISWI